MSEIITPPQEIKEELLEIAKELDSLSEKHDLICAQLRASGAKLKARMGEFYPQTLRGNWGIDKVTGEIHKNNDPPEFLKHIFGIGD